MTFVYRPPSQGSNLQCKNDALFLPGGFGLTPGKNHLYWAADYISSGGEILKELCYGSALWIANDKYALQHVEVLEDWKKPAELDGAYTVARLFTREHREAPCLFPKLTQYHSLCHLVYSHPHTGY